MRFRAHVAVCCALALAAVGARAQSESLDAELPDSDSAYLPSAARLSPGRAFLYSAAVPGTGQLYAGRKRGYAYLAGEAALAVGYLLSRSDANDIEQQYIDAVRAGVTFDGVGDFDEWNQEDFEHATDYDNWLNTYTDDNGQPVDRVGPFYWKDIEDFRTQDPRDPAQGDIPDSAARLVSKQLRTDSNAAFKRTRGILGAMIFNHLVSAIDARVSARIHNADLNDDGLGLRAEPVDTDGAIAVTWAHGF
jgi:hypothetical protein